VQDVYRENATPEMLGYPTGPPPGAQFDAGDGHIVTIL
jgi:hypothetical protein